jgi:PAS domain S-box-containing protein
MTDDKPTADTGTTSAREIRRRAVAQVDERPCPKSSDLSAEETDKVLHEFRVHQIELEMQNEELQRTHHALDALRSRYFDLYDLAPIGYVTLAESGLILESNLRFSSLVGLPKEEIINQPLSRFIFSDDQDIFYLHRKKLFASGKRQTFQLRLKRREGSPYWAHLEATRASYEDPETASCRLTATDISEQRMLEEGLAQENRMASMGMLAAGIAHEINNPLTAVLYNAETMAKELPSLGSAVTRVCQGLQKQLGDNAIADIAGEDDAELLRGPTLAHLGNLAMQTATASQRIHDIMKGLTSFARPQPNESKAMDINDAARDAIGITANQIKYRAKLVADLGQAPGIGRFRTTLTSLCQPIDKRRPIHCGRRQRGKSGHGTHLEQRRPSLWRGLRYGVRDTAVKPRFGVRAVFHNEEPGSGNGPRPRHLAKDCHRPWWQD